VSAPVQSCRHLSDQGKGSCRSAAWVFQTGTAPADGFGNCLYGLFLVDQSFVDPLFHVQQLLGFTFQHLRDRNSCPAGNQLRDLFFGDLAADLFFFQPFILGFVIFVFRAQMIGPEFGGFFILLSLRSCFLFVLQLFYFFLQLFLHPAARFRYQSAAYSRPHRSGRWLYPAGTCLRYSVCSISLLLPVPRR